MTIPARFEGKCATCGGLIVRGQQIAWTRGKPAEHAWCYDARVAARSAPQGQGEARTEIAIPVAEPVTEPDVLIAEPMAAPASKVGAGGFPVVVIGAKPTVPLTTSTPPPLPSVKARFERVTKGQRFATNGVVIETTLLDPWSDAG